MDAERRESVDVIWWLVGPTSSTRTLRSLSQALCVAVSVSVCKEPSSFDHV
jgi:hypothetical protein